MEAIDILQHKFRGRAFIFTSVNIIYIRDSFDGVCEVKFYHFPFSCLAILLL